MLGSAGAELPSRQSFFNDTGEYTSANCPDAPRGAGIDVAIDHVVPKGAHDLDVDEIEMRSMDLLLADRLASRASVE